MQLRMPKAWWCAHSSPLLSTGVQKAYMCNHSRESVLAYSLYTSPCSPQVCRERVGVLTVHLLLLSTGMQSACWHAHSTPPLALYRCPAIMPSARHYHHLLPGRETDAFL